jgi:hypothetical protein
LFDSVEFLTLANPGHDWSKQEQMEIIFVVYVENRENKSNNPFKNLLLKSGAAPQRWVLQRLHHKTDL